MCEGDKVRGAGGREEEGRGGVRGRGRGGGKGERERKGERRGEGEGRGEREGMRERRREGDENYGYNSRRSALFHHKESVVQIILDIVEFKTKQHFSGS